MKLLKRFYNLFGWGTGTMLILTFVLIHVYFVMLGLRDGFAAGFWAAFRVYLSTSLGVVLPLLIARSYKRREEAASQSFQEFDSNKAGTRTNENGTIP